MPRLTMVLAAVAALVAAAAIAGSAAPGARAQTAPTFTLSPQNQTVDLSAGTVQVQVQVQNASNMASFQFVLRYDRGVLDQPDAEVGPFLGTSGLTPQCLPAAVDGTDGPGTVLFGCANGDLNHAGASGSGVVATVTFHLAGGATSSIAIEKAHGGDPDGAPLCGTYASPNCPAQGGSITVSGGDASKDQGYAPTPTPAPVDPGNGNGQPVGGTPISHITPAAGNGSGSSGSSSSGGSATTGGGGPATGSGSSGGGRTGTIAGSSGSVARSGATGTAGGAAVGKFGYGPQPRDDHHVRNTLLVALALSAIGLMCLRGGALMKKMETNVRQ